MALSEREQRLLDELERGFYQSEADVMRTQSEARRRVNYRSVVLGILVVVVGVGILIGGVAAQQLWLGLIGFAAMLGGVMLMLMKGTEPDVEEAAPRDGSTKNGSSGTRESLSERAERRWNQRMEGER